MRTIRGAHSEVRSYALPPVFQRSRYETWLHRVNLSLEVDAAIVGQDFGETLQKVRGGHQDNLSAAHDGGLGSGEQVVQRVGEGGLVNHDAGVGLGPGLVGVLAERVDLARC